MQSEPKVMSLDDFTSALDSLVTGIIKTEKQILEEMEDSSALEKFWYFKYNYDHSSTWNFYEFNGCLDIYRRKCRAWETIHNGNMSVVERVRDKYLWPKIVKFLEDVKLAEAYYD